MEVRGIKMLPEEYSTKGGTTQTSPKRLANDTRIHFYGTILLDTREHHLQLILPRLDSPNLMWLSCRDCPFPSLPPIRMENLRFLKVEGSGLQTLWQDESSAPLQLRVLEISTLFLRNIPESLGNLTYLQYMHLCGCQKLKRLPDSFGNLVNLQYLSLLFCDKLERLPDSFGNLVNLEYLNLDNCPKLATLPYSFGNLVNLQHLELSACWKLARLPDSFGNLVNLQHLELSAYWELARLPDSFGNLVNLQHLELSACWELARLPDSFGNLVNLQHMNLSFCVKLERLPDSFGNLVNLQHMNLSNCELERLPDSFGNLTNLQYIDLTECKKLERLPSSFGSLSSLKSFKASNCSNLSISSDTFGNIRTLEHIDLSNCGEIERWPSQLAHQRFLNTLKLQSSKNCQAQLGGAEFKELPSAIGDLSDLEVLWIGSPFLGTLPPSLGNLGNLKELMVKGCTELKRLPCSVGLLTQLTSLEVVGCPAMKLPFKMVKGQRKTFDEDVCSNLQRLPLDRCCNCGEIERWPSQLVHQRFLNTLKLRGAGFKELPSAIGDLSDLEVVGCPAMELPFKIVKEQRKTVGTLKSESSIHQYMSPLQRLTLWEDPEISEVSFDEDVCSNLRHFSLYMCRNVEKVVTLPSTLIEVEFENCTNLRNIEGLRGLQKLRTLKIKWSEELHELPSIETLVSLEELDVVECVKLKTIRNLAQLTKLKKVWVVGCTELEELERVENCNCWSQDCPKLQWLRKKNIDI